MGVGVYESGDDDLACAINFYDLPAVFLHPGIAESLFRPADRDDLAADAEDSSVFEDVKFREGVATTGVRRGAGRPKRYQLADVDEEEGQYSSWSS
jgi:hypothetical protein